MLSKVEVTNSRGDLLTLQLDDISDGIIVQEITGLDPVKASLASSPFAGLDGEQFQSARRQTRNITMQLGLDPDPTTDTVQSLRKSLYGFFMPKSQNTMRFYLDDGLTADTVAIVESCETAFFSQDPAMDISMICYDPDFTDATPVHLTGSTTSGTTNTTVSYDGTVETGIILTVNVNRTMSGFTIYHDPENDVVSTLDFSASLLSGDVVVINTVSGSKGATLTRSGVSSSILYGISPQSIWTQFQPGDNGFRVYATGAAVPYTIDYVTRYGGL